MTSLKISDPPPNPLQPLYMAWMNDLLAGAIPHETKSTCSNCAMAAPTGTELTVANASDFFDPKLKCCTFLPTLPNFLVGRILLDDDPAFEQGRATVHMRIRTRLAVTPLGMGEPALQSLIYAGGATSGFGRSKSLLCPHHLPDEGGKCGVWKNRNAICATWFCKHERGAVGKHFWTALQQLLMTAEKDLSSWCLTEMGLSDDAMKTLFPPLQPIGKDLLTAEAIDHSADIARYQAAWGNWLGREDDFYCACAQLVNALTWADVLRICGPSLRIQAKLLTQTYDALITRQLPPRLKLNDLKIARLDNKSMQISTYSVLDPLQMPSALLAALPHFDGRTVDEVMAEVVEQKKLRLSSSVLQKLVDFGILASPS